MRYILLHRSFFVSQSTERLQATSSASGRGGDAGCFLWASGLGQESGGTVTKNLVIDNIWESTASSKKKKGVEGYNQNERLVSLGFYKQKCKKWIKQCVTSSTTGFSCLVSVQTASTKGSKFKHSVALWFVFLFVIFCLLVIINSFTEWEGCKYLAEVLRRYSCHSC